MGGATQLGPATRDRLTAWLFAAEVIDWDMAVAETWGALMGRARRRGRPRPVNDTWIAASCLPPNSHC